MYHDDKVNIMYMSTSPHILPHSHAGNDLLNCLLLLFFLLTLEISFELS